MGRRIKDEASYIPPAKFNVLPDAAISYYKEVVARLGAKTAQDSVRMFMVPGMGPCTPAGSHGSFNSIKVSK